MITFVQRSRPRSLFLVGRLETSCFPASLSLGFRVIASCRMEPNFSTRLRCSSSAFARAVSCASSCQSAFSCSGADLPCMTFSVRPMPLLYLPGSLCRRTFSGNTVSRDRGQKSGARSAFHISVVLRSVDRARCIGLLVVSRGAPTSSPSAMPAPLVAFASATPARAFCFRCPEACPFG
jgi:hypothetical protein